MNRKSTVKALAAATVVAGLAPGLKALADEDLPKGLEGYRLAGEVESCVNVRNIDQTKVIDDRNIVFKMKGSKRGVWLNRLNGMCAGISHGDPFAYSIPSTQLCAGEILHVVPDVGAGGTCALGVFERLEPVEDQSEG